MACTHKSDTSGSGVIILEENLVQISLITTEILLFMKCDIGIGLQFQGQLMRDFCCQPQLHHFGDSIVNICYFIAEI